MSGKKIGVLIVEDSESLQQILIRAIEEDSNLEVRAVARNGEEAVAMAARLKPNVITMDIMMPKLDGIEAIRRIMASTPTPIVVITAVTDSAISFEAIQAGALEVAEKPLAITTPDGKETLSRIIETIKLMAGVKVVTRKLPSLQPSKRPRLGFKNSVAPGMLAIAASTGGPVALKEVFKKLSASYPIPILVVQHITTGFGQGLINWLNSEIALQAVPAVNGETPVPGNIYFAPDDRHLLLSANGKILLSNALPVKGHRPSANLLFDSVGHCFGGAAVGIILTGMGSDGTEGLSALKKAGGFCIAQDEASSVVFGMPKAAIDAGLADLVISLEEIGIYLAHLAL
ncbi:MAG: chemotaxis-specific protein-glutamate methyltransferase CheB [Acidobacteria bacterium]|nr:chemotaxis-specific protein-glutamate methyltransferase CheB [Acidobacteriota bacterium]